MSGRLRLAGMLLLSAGLVACGSRQDELEQWVADIKARPSKPISPIPQMKQYQAYAYIADGKRDPFIKVLPANGPGTSGPRPDLNRNPEALEEFPLDGLRMRGTISFAAGTFALIQAPDGVIHRVTLGNYMGHNYGQITAISENLVSLMEIVPDGFGGWTQRPAELSLAE